MPAERKNYDWVDTIRVLSTLEIVLFHYACVFFTNPNVQDVALEYFNGLGHFGVAAFFGISGYLVVNSLDHSKSVLDFYRRKIIRVVLPFTVIYVLAIIALWLLSMINFQWIPINFSLAMIVGLVPIDINVTKFLGIPHLFITGEWFIGTIIWMYLIAPFVHKFLRKNVPLTMIAVIIIACISEKFFMNFQTLDRIFNVQTIFLVRLPEFALGMALFVYKDKIFNNTLRLLAILLTFAMVAYTTYQHVDVPIVWLKYFFGAGTDLHLILALLLVVYMSFIIADFLNKAFPKVMKPINDFKDISYMVILSHHVIIYLIAKAFSFETMGAFGVVVFFFITTVVVVIAGYILREYYLPIEKKLLG